MPKINKNWGVLERWWAVEWARLQATWYSMWRPWSRIYLENVWVEDRNQKDIHGEPIYKEHVTYIAVISGTIQKGNLKVLREFFGELRIPLEAYNADAPEE